MATHTWKDHYPFMTPLYLPLVMKLLTQSPGNGLKVFIPREGFASQLFPSVSEEISIISLIMIIMVIAFIGQQYFSLRLCPPDFCLT